jgi:hypothetical protein
MRRLHVLSWIALAVGCEFTIPSGRFACTTDDDCPPGLLCGSDDRCVVDPARLDSGTPRDAGPGDSGAPICPALTAPANGSVTAAVGVEDEVATYSCEGGFVLTGNGGASTRVCQSDGTWSGSDPSCDPVLTPCDPNPCLNGGTCAVDGSSFTCTCDPTSGFTGPTCTDPVECPELPLPDNGWLDRTTGGFGDIATYGCESGFYLAGNLTRTCQGDGTWTGSDPTCPSTGGYPVWPMPGTPPHPFQYTTNADTTIDLVTQLEWERNVDPGIYDWAQARAYCASLVLGGKSDWRLPTRIELVSTVDFARYAPPSDPTAFPSTPTEMFWTASRDVGDSQLAWIVGHISGNSTPWGYNVNQAQRVRCTRFAGPAGASVTTHFTINADDTVTDNHTGLVWQRTPPSTSYFAGDAIVYCDGLTHAGSSEWRLPTISEIQTIVDETRIDPAIDTSVFPGVVPEYYWSSSDAPGDATWIIHFGRGITSGAPNGGSVPWRVRCVR